MIVSYAPKQNKSVVLTSTMRDRPEVDDGEAKKPEEILDYNNNFKCAVDVLDQ
jgi:hypothetical protein